MTQTLSNQIFRSVAIPRLQTVMIINDNSEPLELKSISGNTSHFYSSFFKQTTLPAHGGNTSINIYCLPRTIDDIQSTFTIATDRGELFYHVSSISMGFLFRRTIILRFMEKRYPIHFVYDH